MQPPSTPSDILAASHDLQAILAELEALRPSLAVSTPERQRLAFTAWIARARAAEAVLGGRWAAEKVGQVAQSLHYLSRVWWPGRVAALDPRSTPVGAWPGVHLESWRAVATWCSSRIACAESWADDLAREPPPHDAATLFAAACDTLRELGGPLGDAARLDRMPGVLATARRVHPHAHGARQVADGEAATGGHRVALDGEGRGNTQQTGVAGRAERMVQACAGTLMRGGAILVVSIGGKSTFSELLDLLLVDKHLLDEKRHGVLRDMFVDAREVDLAPVRKRLDGKTLPEPEVLLALMRLVQGWREPDLAASARALAARTKGVVKTAAEHLATTAAPLTGEAGGVSVAVLAHSRDSDSGLALARELRRLGMTVWPGAGALPALESFDRKQLEKDKVTAAAVVFGSQAWWASEAMRARLEMLQVRGVRLVGVRAPGAPVPVKSPIEDAVDCFGGWTDVKLDLLRRQLAPGPDGPIEGQAFVEQVTGIRLVWVPGGRFMMGSNELRENTKPAHRVRVSAFWLGETPVTNRQSVGQPAGRLRGADDPAENRPRRPGPARARARRPLPPRRSRRLRRDSPRLRRP